MYDWFESMDKRQAEFERALAVEKQKLMAEPCLAIPEIGDSVLITAAFIMRGHTYELLECRVVDVAATAYKIAVKKTYDKEEEFVWIPTNLVREVLRKKVDSLK